MRLIRKRGTKSSVALLSVAALALATAGILYAHWTDTLSADVDISTGYLGVEWSETGTDDDGVSTNDLSGTDDGGGTLLDLWESSSSDDPSTHGPGPVDRYDKDVARCLAGRDSLDEDPDLEVLFVSAVNTYPSYNCTVYTDVTNNGSVPVKASFLTIELLKDGFPVDPMLIDFLAEGQFGILNETWDGEDPAFEYELILDIAVGIRCGTQIDPEVSRDVTGWFHVEQGAEQGATYSFNMTQEFVNWNEWTPEFCTPGAVVANPDGSIPYVPPTAS